MRNLTPVWAPAAILHHAQLWAAVPAVLQPPGGLTLTGPHAALTAILSCAHVLQAAVAIAICVCILSELLAGTSGMQHCPTDLRGGTLPQRSVTLMHASLHRSVL